MDPQTPLELTLQRGPATVLSTPGELFHDDLHLVWTIERPPAGEHPCIPAGRYRLEEYPSPSHGPVPQLIDVPGRSYIQIHPANWAHELKGCIAPGLTHGPNAVWSSQLACHQVVFPLVFEAINAGREAWLTIKAAESKVGGTAAV